MARRNKNAEGAKRVDIIRAVETPLGFFVLVVLVVEAIFGTLLMCLPNNYATVLIVAMIGLVFCLVIIVAVLAYHRPEALRGQRMTSTDPQIDKLHQRSSTITEPTVTIDNINHPAFVKCEYPKSQHPEFFAEIERIVPEAKKIILIATGLNLIWTGFQVREKHILDLLLQRARSGDAEVTICLGNPFSPHVEDRLIEEEIGDNRPPVGREGILKNVEALVELLARSGNPTNFRVLLFEHYPTFATLVFDDTIFFYPYTYQILGNQSPIFQLNNDNGEVAHFFMQNVERITSAAVPAKDVISQQRDQRYLSDSWIAAAVYIVPQESSRLYQIGTEILGYDIRKEKETDSNRFTDLRPYVNNARHFGLHATVADALFFPSESGIERVEAELRMLSKDFGPFILSGFELVDRIHESGSIALACEDETGGVEAMHHEMVNRIYRIAISSLHASGLTRGNVKMRTMRDNLMIRRYGAPFILNRYDLHFTLLDNPPQDPLIRSDVLQMLKGAVTDIGTDPLEIRELVLVTKTAQDTHWHIRKRFQLSGNR